MKERETFASRLGFVLISAGCAIGLGNVWRFPYIVGQYGGAAFVLIYLLFLVIMGLPIMAMEFSVGRASRKSILASFQVLEPKGSKWHWYGWFGMAGNYLLMMFYTTIAGWLLLYFFKVAAGEFRGLDAAGVETAFGAMQGNVGIQLLFMGIVVVLGMLICSRGLKNGVEKKADKKMFPGYVLINMVMNDDTWYVVRNTRGVTGFVGPGSKPVPLTEEEMASLGFVKTDVLVDFEVGDMITVISGAWKDTVGAIKAINDSKQTITINVEMFGRETPVELGFAEIRKM